MTDPQKAMDNDLESNQEAYKIMGAVDIDNILEENSTADEL